MNFSYILLQAEGEAGSSQLPFILMMVALFAIMYFFMIRPQQKKQKKLQEQRNLLTVGDKIVTAGGIHGKIKDIKETAFVIEIAEGTKITVEKSSVFASPEAVASDNNQVTK